MGKMTENPKIKPCPFCGGDCITYGYARDGKSIGCADCGVRIVRYHGQIHDTVDRLAEAWNDRTPTQVKPLVWEKLQNGDYRAAAPLFGSVRIECYAADEFVVLWSVPGFCDTVVAGTFLTANDAKAAFHTQYTRRILETLT